MARFRTTRGERPPSHARIPRSIGRLGRIWFGSAQGLQARDRTAMDAEAQAQAAHVLDGLRADAAASAAYQQARRGDTGSRQAADTLRRMKATLTRTAASRGDLLQALTDLADRFAPQAGERGPMLSELAPLRPVAQPAPLTPRQPTPVASTR